MVIIGQDPYHGVGQAHGLCFSVQKGVGVPPSLMNMFKELKDDPGVEFSGGPGHGCLVGWAEQGEFLADVCSWLESLLMSVFCVHRCAAPERSANSGGI